MSRSRKKNPIIKSEGDRSLKKIFNRRFRHKKDLDFPSGNAYRKTNETWEISNFAYGYFAGERIPLRNRFYARK